MKPRILFYLGVWAALAVLTLLTWWLHARGTTLAISLLIAGVKTVLVALFFMHLVEAGTAMRLVLPIAAVFVALLLGVTLLEVMNRPAPSRPGAIRYELPPTSPEL